MTKNATIDESNLWEFAEKTARKVEAWHSWKKDGWAIIEKTVETSSYAKSYEDKPSTTNSHSNPKTTFD